MPTQKCHHTEQHEKFVRQVHLIAVSSKPSNRMCLLLTSTSAFSNRSSPGWSWSSQVGNRFACEVAPCRGSQVEGDEEKLCAAKDLI